MEHGDEPAFPIDVVAINQYGQTVKVSNPLPGLSKREYVAIELAKSQVQYEGMEGIDKEMLIGMSLEIADALLARLAALAKEKP